MLLIIASHHDQAAQMLADRWREQGARVATGRDLSTAGWRFEADRPRICSLAVEGRLVSGSEIGGVLMRLPWMTDDELIRIRPADMSYAGAEISAFLVAWLSAATFPVINRPTPTCLMGPSWGRPQWLYHATRAGMRVRDRNSKDFSQTISGGAKAGPFVAVTVVGERCIGPVAPELAAQARRLARLARVEVLTVQFSSPGEDGEFMEAFLTPDISQPDICDAILGCFQEGALAHFAR